MSAFSTLSFRITVMTLALLSLVGIGVAYTIFTPHRELIVENALNSVSITSGAEELRIQGALARYIEILNVVKRAPAVNDLVAGYEEIGAEREHLMRENLMLDRVSDLFIAFTSSGVELHQLRLLSADDDGFEILRVERDGRGRAFAVAPDDLQRKGHRDYVQATRRLMPGEIRLSEIDLNREHGKLETPHVPVLRISTPLFGEGPEPRFVLVANIDLRPLFDSIRSAVGTGEQLFVTNSRGDFLINSERTVSFGFDIGQRSLIQEEFPQLASVFTAGHQGSEMLLQNAPGGGVMHFRKVRFDQAHPERFIGIGVKAIVADIVAPSNAVRNASLWQAAVLILSAMGVAMWYARRLILPLRQITDSADLVANGEMNIALPENDTSEIGVLARSFRSMIRSIDERNLVLEQRNQLKTRLAELASVLRGSMNVLDVCTKAIENLPVSLDAHVGTIYVLEGDALKLMAGYALSRDRSFPPEIPVGAGIVGQAARERRMVTVSDVPGDYLDVSSSLGSASPLCIIAAPLLHDGELLGVVELGFLTAPGESTAEYLYEALDYVAISVSSAKARDRAQVLLESSQRQSEELQKQQEELRASNEELEAQTVMLRERETALRHSEDRTRSIIETAGDGIIVLGEDGCVASFNSAAEHMFGCSRETIVGTKITTLIPGFHDRYAESDLTRELSGEQDPDAEAMPDILAVHKDGHEFVIELAASKFQVENDTNVTLIARDISERRAAERELEAQSRQLQEINVALHVKTESLERQKSEIERKNREVQQAKDELERKADELIRSGRYKSEFLANMSHELRTPLNSILILSKSLSSNPEQNLSADQIDCLDVVHRSGEELLLLIDDILDLAKVEAGKLEVRRELLSIRELADGLMHQFEPIARSRELTLQAVCHDDLPEAIESDGNRLRQILKNLLSNALKFTESGTVTLQISMPPDGDLPAGYEPSGDAIAMSVIDTGPGIQESLQSEIFEAFQQGDGSTARHHGGTGLGLTISRELASLLGGCIGLDSTRGSGSTFTLFVGSKLPPAVDMPQHAVPAGPETEHGLICFESTEANAMAPHESPPADPDGGGAGSAIVETPGAAPLTDADFDPDVRSVLIVEDDEVFARIISGNVSRFGWNTITVESGTDAIFVAVTQRPDAIILDLNLPDVDGLALLDMLKSDLRTRHIPVHVISGQDARAESHHRGAIGFLGKPVSEDDLQRVLRKTDQLLTSGSRRVLIVEDDPDDRKALEQFVRSDNVEVVSVGRGEDALACVGSEHFDCLILDLGLPDISGFELLERLQSGNHGDVPPVIVHTGRELNEDEHKHLVRYAGSVIVKGGDSAERLLRDLTLFLHSAESTLPPRQQDTIRGLYEVDAILKNRVILVVDDDLRNTFALSHVLAKHGMDVDIADNGELALEKLAQRPNVDFVLIDIMMPVMDGYETMRRIRANSRWARLPIVALTANAMKDDRSKCIDAGANDYLAKPVDVEKLLSIMRIWMYQSPAPDRRSANRPWSVSGQDEDIDSAVPADTL